jgi:hypothetical protein
MKLIEHDIGLVLGICDRVVVLEFDAVAAAWTRRRHLSEHRPSSASAQAGSGEYSVAPGAGTLAHSGSRSTRGLWSP